jgi:D-alanyl-D-alanine carboxypeptidase/D-alanyl-D-alanine carboxypeptidase (penicillin-binding protein 5/6)
VTLNDRTDWDDHLALYDWGFSVASPYSPALPENLSVPLEGADAASLRVYARQPLTLTAWNGVPPECEETVLLPPFVTAPLNKGDTVGELVYTHCHIEIARLPLVAACDVPAAAQKIPKKSLFSRFFQWFCKL